MSEARGNWNEFTASPSILSLSRRSRPQVNDQQRKAKTGEAANEGAAEAAPGSEPDMYGAGASVAAE